jgi:C_GCAxxG_C_C family probable redox protein
MHRVNPSQFQSLGAGKQIDIGSRGEVACALFRQGYNCSQAVFGAFAEDLQIDRDTAMRIASSFGGGMGRMREVCGAVSGMLMVCGLMHGYATPETGDVKADHYRMVQKLSAEFRDTAGSIICRDLLGGTVSALPTPTARTPEFYQKRPCERLIHLAATIAEKEFF